MPHSAGRSERSASAAQQAWRDHPREPAPAGVAELLSLVHGRLSQAKAKARELVERLQRLAHDFARQHLLDQKLPEAEKRQYTLVMGMRSWLFEHFKHLQRAGRG